MTFWFVIYPANTYYLTKPGLEKTIIEKTALPTGGPRWGSGKWTTKTWKDREGNTSFLWRHQERLQRGGGVWVVVTEEQSSTGGPRRGWHPLPFQTWHWDSCSFRFLLSGSALGSCSQCLWTIHYGLAPSAFSVPFYLLGLTTTN